MLNTEIMKKRCLFVFFFAIARIVAAQPASGIAPNFTLRDLNGNWHTLYNYLDQGKTVFLDFSAAWCQPCWNFHNTHIFRDLYQQHGPSGMPGVNANTTNDVMVFFIEGEPNNTRNQLYGIAGSGSSQATQGNWVTGTPYPILDTNATTTTALLNAWGVNSYPTIFMICRDRLVYKFNQQPASQLYSAALYGCPNYAPSTTVDAKAVSYKDETYFFCTPDPMVRFQNYSLSSTITSANINIFSNNTQVYTHNWTGNLPPYQIANVQLPPFTANPYSGYRFEVQVTGDSYIANNKSTDSLFWVYSAGNAATLPKTENFDASPLLPYKFRTSSYYVEPVSNSIGTNPVIYVKGTNGQNTRAIRFHNRLLFWYKTLDLVIGNYNTQTTGSPKLEFDVAYAQYNGGENDTLEVLVSKDCGTTWQVAWMKSGNTLATRTPVGNFTDFYPQQASHWRHETVDLSPYKDPNTMIIFRTHCALGNDIWIDNLNLHSTTNINEIAADNAAMNIYPNPVKEDINIELDFAIPTKGDIVITSITGQVFRQLKNLSLTKGINKITIPSQSLSSGLYYVIFKNNETSITRKFMMAR